MVRKPVFKVIINSQVNSKRIKCGLMKLDILWGIVVLVAIGIV